jgi:hypothetical protein
VTNLEAIKIINAEARALEDARREAFFAGDRSAATVEAYHAARRGLTARAKAAGYIGIFDGSFKLNAAQVAADRAGELA